jgi:hypothetical protein
MLLIVAKYLIPKGYRGLTIFPFVLLKSQNDKENMVIINHEKIHLRQQLELLILPFYIWYVFEYLFRLIQYNDGHLAYKNICFEREAYSNETDLNYLNKRPFWSWIRYLKN